jgi:deazaflavin-dependent oxidoreductase (nitroreductase family)
MSDSRQPWWQKPVNKLMISMQKLGIPTGSPMVLTVPGRRTGRPRATPITPFNLQGRRYGVAGNPGADWARNARAAGAGALLRGGKALKVNIVELSAHEAGAVLRAYPENVPVGVRLAKRSERVRGGTPDVIDGGNSRYTEFEALAGIIPVFRLDPITP